jgi:DNA-binding transcriptional MerR regulator
MSLLDIAEVAERSGLAPSALRYYEKRDLIASEGRNGLRRAFRPEVLDRLSLISCARAAGFTLAEIARFLTATPTTPYCAPEWRRRPSSWRPRSPASPACATASATPPSATTPPWSNAPTSNTPSPTW